MTEESKHSGEQEPTWRDYCKHYGPCATSGDRCRTPDDPAYVADMERRYPPE